jgi:hypothetical protein
MIIYNTVMIIVYCYDDLIIVKCASYGYRYDSVLEIDQLKFFFWNDLDSWVLGG